MKRRFRPERPLERISSDAPKSAHRPVSHGGALHEMREYDGYDLVVAKGGLKMKKSSGEDAWRRRNCFWQRNSWHRDRYYIRRPRCQSDIRSCFGPGITCRTDKEFNCRFHSDGESAPDALSAELIEVLKNLLGDPIVDKTGLSGWYDCTLDFHRGAPIPGMDEPNDLIPYIPLAVDETRIENGVG